MSRIAEFNQVIQGAKQQRAEMIGSTLKAQALPVAFVVALALTLALATSMPFQFEGQPVHASARVC